MTLVVVYHFLPDTLPAGFLGVDLFFALSGYLITRLLLAEIAATGTLRLAAFYGRRVRRLAPSVIVLVLVAAVASALFWPDLRATLRGSVLSSFGYVTNWWLIWTNQSYFMAEGRPPMLEHLWSLAIEEQFYLVWPLAIAVMTGARISLRRRESRLPPQPGSAQRDPVVRDRAIGDPVVRDRPFGAVGGDRVLRLAGLAFLLAAGSAALMAAFAITQDVPYSADSSRVYFGSDTHCMALFAGAAAASWAARRRVRATAVLNIASLDRVTRNCRDVAAGAGLVFVLYAAVHWNEYTAGIYRTGFLTFSLVAAGLVALVARDGSRVARLLDARAFTAVGHRSYAIYLWHWPVDVVTRPGIDVHASALAVFPLRVLLTGVLAYASHRWVEVGLRSRLTREGLFAATSDPATLVRPPGVMLGAPIAATLLLVNAVPAGSPNAVIDNISAPPAPAPAHVSAVRPSARPGRVAATRPHGGQHADQLTSQHSGSASCLTSPTRRHGVPLTTSAVAFGDSVMLGAASDLHARIPHLSIHATVGLLPRPILAAVRAARDLPPVVIIHLGDNGFVPPGDLSDTLDALRGESRVVLVTARVPRDWQDAADRVLRQAASRYPNVGLADWQAESQQHDDWFVSDGVHLTSAGIAAFGACIASTVTQNG